MITAERLKEIEQDEAKLKTQVEAKLMEVRAMPVDRDLNPDHCEFAPLRFILEKLELSLMPGQRVRLDQGVRIVIFERTMDGWNEIVSACTEAPTWSNEKGWND